MASLVRTIVRTLLLSAVLALPASAAGATARAGLPAAAGYLNVGEAQGSTGGEWALASLRALPPSEGTADAALAVTDIAPLPVPYYSQRDPRWGCEQLGTCTCDRPTCQTESFTTIADAGCYPTCQAMLFAYYNGGQYADPSQYNACLLAHNGYEAFPGACSSGKCGALDDPPTACRPQGLVYVGPSLDKSVLDQDLLQGYPAIGVVDVNVPGRLPHAVIVLGKRNGRYIVNDPYYNRGDMRPEEIYGFHRWRGPVPGGVAATVQQTLSTALLAAPAGGESQAASAAPTPAPILGARFRQDVTIPDGALTTAGTPFHKTWELQNTGNVSWPEGTSLVWVSGARLGAGGVEAVDAPPAPAGEAAQVSVDMVAPPQPGRYVSRWQLEAPDGRRIGPVIWVDIVAVR